MSTERSGAGLKRARDKARAALDAAFERMDALSRKRAGDDVEAELRELAECRADFDGAAQEYQAVIRLIERRLKAVDRRNRRRTARRKARR